MVFVLFSFLGLVFLNMVFLFWVITGPKLCNLPLRTKSKEKVRNNYI
jgi:hypothetical protein